MTRSFAVAVAVAASIGAGFVHLALAPEHLEELGSLGWGFVLAAALQFGWPVAMLASRDDARSRKVAIAGIAINVAILGAWVVSRTVGLPAGETPWTPESIGRVDVVTALLEVALVAALVGQLENRALAVARGPRMATVLAVLVVVAGTAAALAPDGAHANSDGHGGSHAEAHEAMIGAESAP